jgi:hypothetical protein
MVYTVDVFTNLRKNFATWDALKAWLTSAEGGQLRVIEPRDTPLALIRYNKDRSNMSLPHVRWCRSVVVHKETRLPVCVSPPKSCQPTENFLDEVTVAEEFVDGTMMNAFHFLDGENHITSVATRSRIGAECRFLDEGKMFKTMFYEALEEKKIATFGDILPPLEDERVGVFTSVVLQHPENRIVQKVTKPLIQIVHQGYVTSDGTVYIIEDPEDHVCAGRLPDPDLEIQPFNLDSIRGAKSVEAWVDARGTERGVGFQGIVLKDGKGNRWRFRNHGYDLVRNLRGNETNHLERFARLRRNRNTEQYLAFYPEDREAFYQIEGRLRKNTKQLTQFYIDTFRARKTPYHQLPWPYKHHVSVLHNMFKDTLKAKGMKVGFETVIKYVNALSLEDLVNMAKEHKTDLVLESKKAGATNQEASVDVAQ